MRSVAVVVSPNASAAATSALVEEFVPRVRAQFSSVPVLTPQSAPTARTSRQSASSVPSAFVLVSAVTNLVSVSLSWFSFGCVPAVTVSVLTLT